MKWILIKIIRFYQLAVSPLFAHTCRHEPSCSRYAIEAVEVHGSFKGLWLSLGRILKCHPWGTWGPDPVPHKK